MKLPFTSRRKAEEAMCLLVEITRRCMADADKMLNEERAAHRKAEAELAAERDRHQQAKRFIARSHGARYNEGTRLTRALRAVAQLRAEAAVQRRVIRQLTDRLLDATGYQGEPLLPAARVTLDLDKEDA